jgi:hypothetical protein
LFSFADALLHPLNEKRSRSLTSSLALVWLLLAMLVAALPERPPREENTPNRPHSGSQKQIFGAE